MLHGAHTKKNATNDKSDECRLVSLVVAVDAKITHNDVF